MSTRNLIRSKAQDVAAVYSGDVKEMDPFLVIAIVSIIFQAIATLVNCKQLRNKIIARRLRSPHALDKARLRSIVESHLKQYDVPGLDHEKLYSALLSVCTSLTDDEALVIIEEARQ